MLKIKDNIDLKELEKFGFKCYEKGEYYFVGFPFGGAKLLVSKNRNIDFDYKWEDEDFELLDILFDLIQAGIVEKAEKEN